MILGLIGCFGVLAVSAITVLAIAISKVAKATQRVVKQIANVVEESLDNVGQFLEEKLQELKKILNLSPDDVHDIGSGVIDDALNSSQYINSYDLLGGENIFEAMWDEFYDLD